MISLTPNRSLTPQNSQRVLQIYNQNFTTSCQFLQLSVCSHIPMPHTRQWLVSVIRDTVFVYKAYDSFLT